MAFVNNLGHIPQAHIVAYRASTEQDISSASWTNVETDTVGTGEEATYGITKTSAWQFTINKSNWYRIFYKLWMDRSSAGNSRETRILVNSLLVSGTNFPPMGTAYLRQVLWNNEILYLNKNDVVVVQVYHDAGSVLKLYSTRVYTNIRIVAF